MRFCKKCGEICQFKAIIIIGETVLPFSELCHSCGGCMEVCPEGAITETGRELGVIERGERDGLEFVHGRLRIGEAMSPPLIRKVRSYTNQDKVTIIDAPPGTRPDDCDYAPGCTYFVSDLNPFSWLA